MTTRILNTKIVATVNINSNVFGSGPSISGFSLEQLLQTLTLLSGEEDIEYEFFSDTELALYIILNDVDSLSNEDEINSLMQNINFIERLDIGTKQSFESFVFSELENGDVPLNSGFATLAGGSDGGKFIKLIGK